MKPKKTRKNQLSSWNPLIALPSDISHAIALERLGPKITERVLWRIETDEPQIALTFDDGPHPESTPAILKILKRFHIPATFFLEGKHIASHPDVAQKVVQEGHEVGNHTYNHSVLFLLTEKQLKDDIMRTDVLLRGLDGHPPKFFRPPMGFFSKRVLDIVEELGYKMVVGDVYPRDPHRPGTQKIIQRVLERTTPGSIIILHDGGNTSQVDRTQTHEAVEEIIPRLKDKGFQFVRVSTLAKLKR